ncbi:MAG: DUF2378 family protein [Thermoplasmata archaeon]
MTEKKVRGSVLNGFIKYIERSWGEAGTKEFSDYAGYDPNKIDDKKWYDAELLGKVHTWLAEEKGKKYVRMAGRYTVQDLGILSYLVKFASVKTLLKKAPKSYRDAFNYGDSIITVEKNRAIAKMKDVVIDDYTCDAWRGVFEGVLEATNTQGKVEIFEDKTKGENDCYYEINW